MYCKEHAIERKRKKCKEQMKKVPIWPERGQCSIGKGDHSLYRSAVKAGNSEFPVNTEIFEVLGRLVPNLTSFKNCPSSVYCNQCIKQRLQ